MRRSREGPENLELNEQFGFWLDVAATVVGTYFALVVYGQ